MHLSQLIINICGFLNQHTANFFKLSPGPTIMKNLIQNPFKILTLLEATTASNI